MYYRDDEEQTKPLAPFFVIFSPPNFAIKRRSPKSERMMRSLSWIRALLLLSSLLSSIGEGVVGTIPRGARTTATTTGAAFVEEGEDRLFSPSWSSKKKINDDVHDEKQPQRYEREQRRSVLWSHKAPNLNLLDDGSSASSSSSSSGKSSSIADQLVKELDTVVDGTLQNAAEAFVANGNTEKISSNEIENAILDSESFREKLEQNGGNDPGWTDEDRQLEESLETKWVDNPEEDISPKWHDAYEEKYSAGIVDEKKEEVLEIEEEMEKSGGELTFGELMAKSATSGKKNSKSKKTRKEKSLKSSSDVLNVVLVGNGKSVLKKSNGKSIDSADVVGRFNYFETKGFEKKVGTRLDLWFLGELRQPGPQGSRGSRLSTGRMDMKVKPTLRYIVPVVYETPGKCSKESCKPSNAKLKQRLQTIRTVKKAYAKYGIRKMLEIMPIEVQHKLSTKYGYTAHWPSSGILAIVYCLEKYPKATVTITGYDFMGGNLGHYWEKVKKKGTVHSMKGEASFIAKLAKSGRVKVM